MIKNKTMIKGDINKPIKSRTIRYLLIAITIVLAIGFLKVITDDGHQKIGPIETNIPSNTSTNIVQTSNGGNIVNYNASVTQIFSDSNKVTKKARMSSQNKTLNTTKNQISNPVFNGPTQIGDNNTMYNQ